MPCSSFPCVFLVPTVLSSQIPYSNPPHPEDSLDFCSLRVKKVIGTDLASNLSEDDPEDQWIKWAIAPYIQTSYCTESDYAAGYGKARDKDLFLNQVWSPMKLAGLRPDLRKWVEKKLDERRKRNRPQKGENPSLDNNIMQLSTSQQNEQFSDKKQSLSLNFAASINRFVPNLDAALRSIKDNDGLHQLGPSFVRWPPAFPVLAVP